MTQDVCIVGDCVLLGNIDGIKNGNLLLRAEDSGKDEPTPFKTLPELKFVSSEN